MGEVSSFWQENIRTRRDNNKLDRIEFMSWGSKNQLYDGFCLKLVGKKFDLSSLGYP